MKNQVHITFALIALLILTSCNSSSKQYAASQEKNIVEVTARDFSFELDPEILSGWSTFRFINSGHAEHFFLLNLLPDSVSFEDYLTGVTKPFDIVFDSMKAGMSKADAGAMLGQLISPWYFTSVISMGGTGIISAGQTAQTTMKLEPGTYVMECYIKEKGVFHTALGMIRQITVKQESSAMQPPTPNVNLTLTNYEIEIKGELTLGLNTLAVHFKEHPQIGLGNDVHLIRLSDSTVMDDVIYWLDWMNIEGLQSPAPVVFLGGTQEMPVGHTAYFTVDLEPGRYAFIAESSADKGMISLFEVE